MLIIQISIAIFMVFLNVNVRGDSIIYAEDFYNARLLENTCHSILYNITECLSPQQCNNTIEIINQLHNLHQHIENLFDEYQAQFMDIKTTLTYPSCSNASFSLNILNSAYNESVKQSFNFTKIKVKHQMNGEFNVSEQRKELKNMYTSIFLSTEAFPSCRDYLSDTMVLMDDKLHFYLYFTLIEVRAYLAVAYHYLTLKNNNTITPGVSDLKNEFEKFENSSVERIQSYVRQSPQGNDKPSQCECDKIPSVKIDYSQNSSTVNPDDRLFISINLTRGGVGLRIKAGRFVSVKFYSKKLGNSSLVKVSIGEESDNSITLFITKYSQTGRDILSRVALSKRQFRDFRFYLDKSTFYVCTDNPHRKIFMNTDDSEVDNIKYIGINATDATAEWDIYELGADALKIDKLCPC